MKVDVLNMQGAEGGARRSSRPAIFEAPIKQDLMHQALVRQLANARLGTHKTKTRAEVVRRRAEALAPEGHRPRPAGLDPVAASGRRRRGAHAHAA